VKRLLLTACCLALVACPGRAALDPETNKPYHVVIVLSVAQRPQFSPVFRDQIKRQLRDFLQGALGPMGDVEVADKHPLLNKVKTEGVKKALDGYNEVSDTKLHFVLIDAVHGSDQHDHYLIQTRQYDGMTATASPVREAKLPDPSGREDVGKMAVRLVSQDFGLIGTIDPQEGDKKADIVMKLKGGKRASPIERWINAGDVFALSLVTQRGSKLHAERVESAFVQVTSPPKSDDPGECRCRLFYRYKPNPVSTEAHALGVRAIKLGTITTRIQLRFVNEENREPAGNIRVNVGAAGYGVPGDEGPTTNADGLVQTGRRYENLAFVQVLDEGKPIAQIPVPVVDQEMMTIPIPLNKNRAASGDFNVHYQLLVNRINAYFGVYKEYSNKLKKLQAEPDSEDEVLKEAQRDLDDMQEQIKAFDDDIRNLKDMGIRLGKGTDGGVGDLLNALATLRKLRDNLSKYQEDMKKAIANRNNPLWKDFYKLIAEAKRKLSQAEVAGALTDYRKAAKILHDLGGDDVKAQLNELNGVVANLDREWQAGQKDPNVRAARQFFYRDWQLYDNSDEIQEHLREAQTNLDVSRNAGDRWALQKAAQAAVTQIEGLQKELKSYKSLNNEDARKRIKAIGQLTEKLKDFYAKVDQSLKLVSSEKE
jgi:hypothetical protein